MFKNRFIIRRKIKNGARTGRSIYLQKEIKVFGMIVYVQLFVYTNGNMFNGRIDSGRVYDRQMDVIVTIN